MKTLLCLLLLSAATLAVEPVTFITLGDIRYESATITKINPLEIRAATADGIARIRFADLSEELRTRFGYDRDEAILYIEQLKAAVAAKKKAEQIAWTKQQHERAASLQAYEDLEAARIQMQRDADLAPFRRTEALKAALRAKYLNGQ